MPFTVASSSNKLNVSYFSQGSALRDTTHFENIFTPPTVNPVVLWPSEYNVDTNISLPKHTYIAAAFKAAGTATTSNPWGLYKIGQSGFTQPITMSISTLCGDFGQLGTVGQNCLVNAQNTQSLGLAWSTDGTHTTANGYCQLTLGQNYYLNIINADVGASGLPASGGTATNLCPAASCTDPVSNGPGSSW